jgi:pSer/pThr/pTyr-binding forkhead associated (FHA) protein
MAPIFCPTCKRLNESGAKICVFCEAPLDVSIEVPQTTILSETDTYALMQEIEAKFIRRLSAPDHGIGIYSSNDPTPITIQDKQEFILGRKSTEPTLEELVDLTPFGGFEEGVSHKHALIRRTGSGYEILDLGSTNGTWLNRNHLISNKPYTLENKSQLYLGRLSLFILYK